MATQQRDVFSLNYALNSCIRYESWTLLMVLLFQTAASKSTVKTLPGFDGTLPFRLETCHSPHSHGRGHLTVLLK
ncbi:hypothetical protein Pfo_016247 [Paulownia fortunei]|nr:hypothetical protein Pfo_016247 [Paulownia fortunei]